jgi:hypothetical protein
LAHWHKDKFEHHKRFKEPERGSKIISPLLYSCGKDEQGIHGVSNLMAIQCEQSISALFEMVGILCMLNRVFRVLLQTIHI